MQVQLIPQVDGQISKDLKAIMAEVTAATNERADKRVAAESALANKLVQMVNTLVEYMDDSLTNDKIAELSGPVAAGLRKSFESLVTISGILLFISMPWISAHRALFDDPDLILKQISDFMKWALQRLECFEKRIATYKEEYAQALEANRSRLKQLDQDWSEAEQDGWK